MNTPTYKESYDKIIEAYFKDEIEPYDSNFCFCGTLSPDREWRSQWDIEKRYPYSTKQYSEMEWALLWTINEEMQPISPAFSYTDIEAKKANPKYEDALFKGMCASLEVLKQIHIERGENVEGEFEFKKRQLVSSFK